MKIEKYMVCFRENFGNNIHQSGVPISDNHFKHVEFWGQKTNQHLKCLSKVSFLFKGKKGKSNEIRQFGRDDTNNLK